jgi:hypothetical protein
MKFWRRVRFVLVLSFAVLVLAGSMVRGAEFSDGIGSSDQIASASRRSV